MYKIIGCAVVWGFALFGFKEWCEKTYKCDGEHS